LEREYFAPAQAEADGDDPGRAVAFVGGGFEDPSGVGDGERFDFGFDSFRCGSTVHWVARHAIARNGVVEGGAECPTQVLDDRWRLSASDERCV